MNSKKSRKAISWFSKMARPFRPLLESLEDRLTPAMDPFVEPPVIQSVNGVLNATLTESIGPARVGDSDVTNAWTYNGSFAGPTLWAQPGDLLKIKIVNQLNEPTNLHTHGLHVSPLGNSDNVLIEIEPGMDNDYSIQIPASHPEGLYWYHPHEHGFVNNQISLGLSGLLVIGRPDGGSFQLNGLEQKLIGIKNALIEGNQIVVTDSNTDNKLQTYLVNGQLNPVLTMKPGEWQVWNIGDIGNDAFYKLEILSVITRDGSYLQGNTTLTVSNTANLSVGMIVDSALAGIPANTKIAKILDGTSLQLSVAPTSSSVNPVKIGFISPTKIPWLAIAEDGNPFTTVGNPQQDVNFLLGMAPGRRWSTVVQAPVTPVPDQEFRLITQGFGGPGQTPGTFDPTNVWPAGTLMTVRFGTDPWVPPSGFVAPKLGTVLNPPNNYYRDLRVLPDSDIAAFRTVVFDKTNDFQIINDYPFPNNPTFQPRLNTVEQWTLSNPSPQDHPFHLHTNAFQVTQAPGGTGKAGLPLWQDVVTVPAGKTVTIRVEFVDYLGTIVYHCHRVDHEDHGMMSLVEMVPEVPIYALGANPGQPSLVKVFNPVNGNLVAQFFAYNPTFTGGVNVGIADVNGDGVYDVITGAGKGGGPHVQVIDGTKLNMVLPNFQISPKALLASFFAYASSFTGGVTVAGGDINNDGLADVITGAGPGAGPHVSVFDTNNKNQTIASFYAFSPGFRGGITVGAGDISGHGRTDLVVGSGPGGGSAVKVIDGMMLDSLQPNGVISNTSLIASFYAFSPSFQGGVFVGTGGIKGFAYDDVIVGAGQGGGPRVNIYTNYVPNGMHMDHSSVNFKQVSSFFAYSSSYTGGVRVGSSFNPVFYQTAQGNKDTLFTTLATGNGLTATGFVLDIAPPPLM